MTDSPPAAPHSGLDFVSGQFDDATPEEKLRYPRPPPVGMLFILFFVLMTVGLILAKEKSTERALAERQKARKATFVRTTRAVPRFSRFTAADVVTKESPIPRAGAASRASAVVGQVATQALDSGAIVMERSILPLPGEWWVLSVPVAAGLTLAAGDSVALLGGVNADSLVVAHDAVVLGMESGRAVVAMRQECARSTARYLVKEPRIVVVRRVIPAGSISPLPRSNARRLRPLAAGQQPSTATGSVAQPAGRPPTTTGCAAISTR